MIEKFTIKELLNKYTLYVPEIQREYVWGNESNCKTVLEPFLRTLDYNLGRSEEYNIGFLYSYTFTGCDNYIIDGQQRFTTTILLLYVLSCVEGEESRMDFLKRIGITEPVMRFTYNVRPQTEVFMRRLFKSGSLTKKNIENQTWFLSTYKQDSTINSMLNAVESIYQSLKIFQNIQYKNILERITFWYFNVDETSQGEELYITMNSRGQKLTSSEKLKPNLFERWKLGQSSNVDKTDYGKKWDEWEEMFYQFKGERKIHSVNDAMDRFLQIVIEVEGEKGIESLPQKTDIISLPVIDKYMTAMKDYAHDQIVGLLSDKNSEYKVLKALIAEGLKSMHDANDAKRVCNIFTNIEDRRGYTCYHNNFLKFIHRYSSSNCTFYDFVLGNTSLCEGVFDQHEIDKIRIAARLGNETEELFWKIQKNLIWKGNISPLISWACKDDVIDSFDLDKFKQYSQLVEEVFADEKLDKSEMDIVRRALLSQKLTDYPRYFRGYTNRCFAKETNHWKTLLRTNSSEFKMFFDKILSGISMQDMIENYDEDADFAEFVKDERLLKFCSKKNIQYWWGTWFLMGSERWNGAHANIKAYKYYLNKKDNETNQDWIVNFYAQDLTCTYYDQNTDKKKHIAIDLVWNSGKNHDELEVDFFMRETQPEEAEKYLAPVASEVDFKWMDNRYRKYVKMPEFEHETWRIMDKMRDSVMNVVKRLNL